ncbi:hypothetical protein EWM64_g6195 [Hericium alpestre]|uniref:AAA+ ATPase domain-containing protein n=1 Tax=Hericium alpestre TaxID=135208 RepID=A0A4Y9ZWF1_9AGAM|nr:hypothetical protein EWM64_g6195 [Hericium alpestre]
MDVKRVYQEKDPQTGQFLLIEGFDSGATEEPVKSSSIFSYICQFRREEETGPYQLERDLIQIDSPSFKEVAQRVMAGRRDVAWTQQPLQFYPDELIAYYSHFAEFVETSGKTAKEKEQVEQVRFFVNFLRTEYRGLLHDIQNLRSAEVITFELLWGIMVPGTILMTSDELTGQVSAPPTGITPGLTVKHFTIPVFTGAKRIVDLRAYPLWAIHDEEQQRFQLIERGKKWWGMKGWCHRWYNNVAYAYENEGVTSCKKYTRSHTHYRRRTPGLRSDLDGSGLVPESRKELKDEEYMMMSPWVYGYALTSREWRSVDCVEDIQWGDRAVFEDLDMDSEDKAMLKTLIEQHTGIAFGSDGPTKPGRLVRKFIDFVEGKGQGLIFNLHGPPGVGKTLTAEAVSNALRCPLYIVGPRDLGVLAQELENALKKMFILAHRWGAIILVDEADVYLERREMRDMGRNAYYPGIVFLTTNRVGAFDPAMKSRIDVSIVFDRLTADARERLWISFLQKTDMAEDELQRFSRHDMQGLRDLPMDGREIKNIVKMASALASRDKRNKLCAEDVLRVMDLSGKRRRSDDSGVFKYFHPYNVQELDPAIVSAAAALSSILAVNLWRHWGPR